MKKFKPQVSKNHYFNFNKYDTKERWISYWHQINEVLKTKPKKVLEVGIGNRTVSDYLRKLKIKVITADIDKALSPDYVVSVTELSTVFNKNSFDTTLCAEVLEHLPFKYFEDALQELHFVTKNYLILSLPHFGVDVLLNFKLPLVRKMEFAIKLPYPKKHKFDGEHYWEIGKKGYSLRKILRIISKWYYIEKTYLVPENPYHRFFVLKVKK